MVRIKQALQALSISERLRLVWCRITSSRLTILYFLLALFHCAVQVGLQTAAHTVNTDAANLIEDVITIGGGQTENFTIFDSKTQTLESCSDDGTSQSCVVLWQAPSAVASAASASETSNASVSSCGTSSAASYSSSVASPSTTSSFSTAAFSSVSATTAPMTSRLASSALAPSSVATPASASSASVSSSKATTKPSSTQAVVVDVVATTTTETVEATETAISVVKRSPFIQLVLNQTGTASDRTLLEVEVTGLVGYPAGVDVSLECVAVLAWPLQILQNTQREDIAFFMFQLWVFGMSMMALLNESIPHTVAALLTHILASIWASFQLVNTQQFKKSFLALTVDGACQGVRLLPNYWVQRGSIEISQLVLNAIALVISAVLSWRIVKVFGWATFRRIGADLQISHIYRDVLVMSILLQLCLFFIITSIALWMDQLTSGAIAKFSSHRTTERIIGVAVLCVLVPWLILGWQSVRRESRKMMIVFLVLSLLLVAGWASEFISSSWRGTFATWTFFAIVSVVAIVLTLAVTLMGIVCLRHFGQDLPRYLHSRNPSDHGDFERVTPFEIEKRRGLLSSIIEQGLVLPGETTDPSIKSGGEVEISPPPVTHTREAKPELARADPFSDANQVEAGLGGPSGDLAGNRSRWSQDSRARGSALGAVKRWVIS